MTDSAELTDPHARFLAILGVGPRGTTAPDGNAERKVITWIPGELHTMVDEAEASLTKLENFPALFQRGGQLVRVVRRGPTHARNIARPAGGVAILAADLHHMVEVLTRASSWVKCDRRVKADDSGFKAMNCPTPVAATLMSRGQWAHIAVPPLSGVIEAPTLRPNGSVLASPGYDLATGLYFDAGAGEFAEVVEAPTIMQAADALAQVEDVIDEFPFADKVDRAVALAAILTTLVRASLPAAPLVGFSATIMGSGKTLLAHVCNLLATGRSAAVIAPPRDAAEEDKTIFSALLEGEPLLVYDNVERPLESDLLCAVLTSEVLRGRVLGTSKTAAVPTNCTFIATGNNLALAGDLSARALVCRLDPRTDHPEARRFSRDLHSWLPDQRFDLVPAALTFLRGWLVAEDRARVLRKLEPWQRFPEWSNLIRGALIWAEHPDPLDALRASQNNDPRRMEHEAVMAAWYTAFESRWTTMRDVEAESRRLALVEDYALKDALLTVAGERGELNLRRLGRYVAKLESRRQGGMMIERGNLRAGMQTWRVSKVG